MPGKGPFGRARGRLSADAARRGPFFDAARGRGVAAPLGRARYAAAVAPQLWRAAVGALGVPVVRPQRLYHRCLVSARSGRGRRDRGNAGAAVSQQQGGRIGLRSEEHTSELPSLMPITYAVFLLKKK